MTSDPTQGNQTSNFLGSFGTAGYANTSYNNYVYLPLVDKFGTITTISLSNTATLQPVVVGNPNIEFYMLTPPVPITSPTIVSVYPDGQMPQEGTNQLTFTVSANSGPAISANGISLILNGVNVTSGLSLTQSNNTWIVSIPIHENAVYTVIISVTNSANASFTYSYSFDTFSETNYEWEAVDYDFSTNGVGGQFIDNPVPTDDITGPVGSGTLATNSYFEYPAEVLGDGAQEGVDAGWITAPGQVMDYRVDGVAAQPTSDYLRPKFLAAQQYFSDPAIGPFNICYYTNSSWLNYTRHYPTNNYYVWGRLAGTPVYTNGVQMSILTSGYGTTLQTSNVLGTFSDPNAAGFQTWHWIPLLDTNGNKAVLSLGQGANGIETLQATSLSPQYVNMEFFMLVPAPSPFHVSASLAGNNQVNLSFPTQNGINYTIMYKNSLTAAVWSPIGSFVGSGSVANVLESLSATQGYYAVLAQ